jgi:heme A synthase
VVIFCYVVAGVCLLAAVQERKDRMRCIGFLLFGILAGLVGAATQSMPDDDPPTPQRAANP